MPNALTTLRIVMVPFFAWALLVDGGESAAVALGRLACSSSLAMITDKIDGDLARKHNLVTDFGKIADPIADKALTGMAFVGLSIIGELWWWVTIVVLVREWGITLMRLWLAKHVVIPAGRGGKLKTVAADRRPGRLLLPLRELEGFSEPVGLVLWWIAVAAMAAAVVLTVWTGIEYFARRRPQRRAAKAAASDRQLEPAVRARLEPGRGLRAPVAGGLASVERRADQRQVGERLREVAGLRCRTGSYSSASSPTSLRSSSSRRISASASSTRPAAA